MNPRPPTLFDNLIYTLDAYKHFHADMMDDSIEHSYSYDEARSGAMYDYTTFFGLQYILKKWMVGPVVTKADVDEVEPDMREMFKHNGDIWTRHRWDYIVSKHGGRLPIRLKAVKEGTKVDVSNALFTVEDTDKQCRWLGDALETLLQQVWFPTTVATRNHFIRQIINRYFKDTVDEGTQWLADYMLHSFGQRACAEMEQAGVGGMAELVNSRGTDTNMAIPFARHYYGAKREGLAYSVVASQHSIATELGKEGEFRVTKHLIARFHNGILSVVSDSYDIENAVREYCTELKPLIMARNGRFVVRPDSPRFKGDTPEAQVLWIANQLWAGYGGTVNSKGYRVLDSHVGIIMGDSLDEHSINAILFALTQASFSAETCVFGCGSYAIDKLNRDTQRFKIAASAVYRNGKWDGIYKQPKDISKISKQGRLRLTCYNGRDWSTVEEHLALPEDDKLEPVFENGELLRDQTFDEVRAIAAS